MPESNDFKELDNRIRSFVNWSYLSDSSKLANAGFYATGYHDLVRCYACGLGLRYLNADDDPLSEHIKNCTSSCAFLNELAGEHQDLNAEEPDISGYHDLVRCYACGLGLRYLNADDDPLSEHIKNCTSSCAFLNELAGEHQDLNAEEPDISGTIEGELDTF
ncbi:BIRC3-like protein [Mya arenaria]|uniref:BIRC3-like protein n=1 Tax=Mya arenaria TaxID=6604 RepID=A0ABY7ELB2_MYAAR|nr:BIRC3-like protein [Mya arenaria]